MEPKIGTCSWNYDSWIGLVYTTKEKSSSEYLRQYSSKYNTAEIDSWFYRLPDRKTVESYLKNVPDDFHFTCKVTNFLTMPHLRGKDSKKNQDFLSIELFRQYIEAIKPMLNQLDAVMLEFEYLNKKKMASLDEFLKQMVQFIREMPQGLPIAMETRNKNYLKPEYFQFLRENNIIHVFSEKLYMPHIYEVYDRYHDNIIGKSVIRLLGGDRKQIEQKTNHVWNNIVEPKDDLHLIAEILRDMLKRGVDVTVNVNNHYEGSAPLTIDRLTGLLG